MLFGTYHTQNNASQHKKMSTTQHPLDYIITHHQYIYLHELRGNIHTYIHTYIHTCMYTSWFLTPTLLQKNDKRM